MNMVCRGLPWVEGAKKWKSLVLRSWRERERECWLCGGRKIEMVQDQWFAVVMMMSYEENILLKSNKIQLIYLDPS